MIDSNKNTILLGYRGSLAHGMYIESTDPNSIDDHDYMGVFLASPSHYIGVKSELETVETFIDIVDLVEYELLKYAGLLLKSNPNVVSLLWLSDQFYIKRTPAGEVLIKNRDLFSSREAYHSFCGYANSQLSKMHKKSDRGFRGEKRKELWEKFGYDTKNAAHCIRLLRMGCEFLETGKMNVNRAGIDASELLGIKTGLWSMERVVSEARRLFGRAEEAHRTSVLPERPDYDQINRLVIGILKEHINNC